MELAQQPLKIVDLPIAYRHKISDRQSDARVHIPGTEIEIKDDQIHAQDISKAERRELIAGHLRSGLTMRQAYNLMHSLGQLFHKNHSSKQMREPTFKQICSQIRRRKEAPKNDSLQLKVKKLHAKGWNDTKISDSLEISIEQTISARQRMKLPKNK